MSPLRALAFTATLLLLVPFGWFRSTTTPIDGGTRSETTIGLPFSPWFTAMHQETRQAIGPTDGTARNTTTSMSFSKRVEFLSWSWLPLIAAILLLRSAFRRLAPAA